MLFGILAPSIIEKMWTGKGVVQEGEGPIREGEGTIKQIFKAAYPLANFEIQKYYQNNPKVNGVYSRNNLPKIKGWGIWN